MKKTYQRPTLSLECFRLDASIALNCGNNKELAAQIKEAYDIAKNDVGFSTSFEEFVNQFIGKDGLDGYCYHTNANVLFNS